MDLLALSLILGEESIQSFINKYDASSRFFVDDFIGLNKFFSIPSLLRVLS